MILVVLAAIVVLATVSGLFVLASTKLYFIPSPAMEPTLNVGDRIAVSKLSRHRADRGDIVVFHGPATGTGPVRDLVKRAVAIGGDTIESQGEALVVNGRVVPEPYVKTASIGTPIRRQTVPPGQVFMLGDNRTNSLDSRVYGPVDEDAIIGRAVMKVWPPGSLERL